MTGHYWKRIRLEQYLVVLSDRLKNRYAERCDVRVPNPQLPLLVRSTLHSIALKFASNPEPCLKPDKLGSERLNKHLNNISDIITDNFEHFPFYGKERENRDGMQVTIEFCVYSLLIRALLLVRPISGNRDLNNTCRQSSDGLNLTCRAMRYRVPINSSGLAGQPLCSSSHSDRFQLGPPGTALAYNSLPWHCYPHLLACSVVTAYRRESNP
jgi:hypothetical protein